MSVSLNKSFFRLVERKDVDLAQTRRVPAVQELDHVWTITAQLFVEALFAVHVLVDAISASS